MKALMNTIRFKIILPLTGIMLLTLFLANFNVLGIKGIWQMIGIICSFIVITFASIFMNLRAKGYWEE